MRPRRYLPGWAFVLVRPFFRHSVSREAYVLRLVGNRMGPVIRRGSEPEPRRARPAVEQEPPAPAAARTGRFARDPSRTRVR